MNVMHANMKITDEIYSNLNDGEVQNRIGSLGKESKSKYDDEKLIQEFLNWQRMTKGNR